MSSSYVLITGGAGFIGTNLAAELAQNKQKVLIFDNLSRIGVRSNLEWLLNYHSNYIKFIEGDVRNFQQVTKAVENAEAVFHLAAQVAVTKSLIDPIHDFEVNARGTLNILEAIRKRNYHPFLLYTSTNKVLGGLESLLLQKRNQRYEPVDETIRTYGLNENWGIQFCSPYGCSKGAADQYVLDYSQCFRIPAVVFRMSCIYGPHQCGNEDQGWVAHFVKQIICNNPIVFYGDGMQVRDILYVQDLIQAFKIAREQVQKVAGNAFNIGGGPSHSVSLIELVRLIAQLNDSIPEWVKEDWRPADQRYYVSDTRKFTELTGWKARTSIQEGIFSLHHWMKRQGSNFLLSEPATSLSLKVRDLAAV